MVFEIFRTAIFNKMEKNHTAGFFWREFALSMHCGPFFIFSRSLYDKVGPFDEQFRIVGDFDWCIRAVKISDKFMLSAKVAGVFKRTGDTLSGGNLRHAAENNRSEEHT